MARFYLSAVPAFREDRPGSTMRATCIEFCGHTFSRQWVEAQNVPTLIERVAEFGATTAAAWPGESFIVLASIDKRDRKPAGYDKANHGNGLGGENWIQTVTDGHAALDAATKARKRAA